MLEGKFAVLYSKNKVKYLNLKIPKLKKGQVLVKIMYSGVCRSQLMEFKGLRGKDKYLPHLFGHEAAGKVELVGVGVKKVKRNDDVILSWIESSGLEGPNPVFVYKGKSINAGKITTFSNYTIVNEKKIIKKPKQITWKFASIFGCAFLTGAGLVLNRLSKIKRNKIISVYGLGGIGMSMLSMLISMGFKNVISIDKDPKKLQIANKIGSKFCVNSSKKDYKKNIQVLFNKDVDICLESGGSIKTIQESFNIINKKSGILYFTSHPQFGKKISINPHELINGKKIFGTWGGYTYPDRDIRLILKVIKKRHIKIFDNIVKLYNLNNLESALRDLDKGKIFRPILNMKNIKL